MSLEKSLCYVLAGVAYNAGQPALKSGQRQGKMLNFTLHPRTLVLLRVLVYREDKTRQPTHFFALTERQAAVNPRRAAGS